MFNVVLKNIRIIFVSICSLSFSCLSVFISVYMIIFLLVCQYFCLLVSFFIFQLICFNGQFSLFLSSFSKGFVFHHANAERLALYLWLDEKEQFQKNNYVIFYMKRQTQCCGSKTVSSPVRILLYFLFQIQISTYIKSNQIYLFRKKQYMYFN